MSRAGSRPFLGALQAFDGALTLPLPDRTRLVRELESDLEQLRSRFLAEGLSADEADRQAVQALLPDGPALLALEAIHEPAYRTWIRAWTRAWGEKRVRIVERGTLAASVGLLLLAGSVALAGTDLFLDPSPFLIPVLALGAAAQVVAVWKAFELWVRGEHGRPARGLTLLMALCLGTLLLGAAGSLVDTWVLAGALAAGPAQAAAMMWAGLVRTCGLLAVTLLLTLGLPRVRGAR